jgi:LEA14-like dessication related protein
MRYWRDTSSKLVRRRPALALLLGLALAAALAGCGVRQLTRGEIKPPKVTLQGITLGAPTGAGWPLFATLRLENPNSQALSVLGYDYDLWLEGRSVAQGVSQGKVNLPAQGETVTEFPIVVNVRVLLGLLPRALQHPEHKLHYRLAGGVRLSPVLAGLVRVPFSFQGELSPQEGAEFLRPYLR